MSERIAQDLKDLSPLRQNFPHLKIMLNVQKRFIKFLNISRDSEMSEIYIQKAHDFVLQIGYSGMIISMFDLEY